MSQWSSGTGLGGWLRGFVGNPNVQQVGMALFQGLGQQILQNINNPTALQKIGNNLEKNPEVPLVAMLKNTDAEQHLDPAIVEKAEKTLAATQ